MNESDYFFWVAVSLFIYFVGMTFVFAGNSPLKVFQWVIKDPVDSIAELTYRNPLFYIPSAVIFVKLSVYISVVCCLVMFLIVIRNSPRELWSTPPPRVKLDE